MNLLKFMLRSQFPVLAVFFLFKTLRISINITIKLLKSF